MSTTTPTKVNQADAPIPPLENGDRLTREEFERRYEAMPHLKKAELIKGRVYMAADVSCKSVNGIPPLENGDHLSCEEFERRYEAMPGVKAELINGVVYMASPVSFENHGRPHYNLIGWTYPFVATTPGVHGGDNSTLRLNLKNMPQPDAFLIIDPRFGGQVRYKDGYIVGGPEWIAEVAASSATYDLHDKLDVYRQNGVREYVVWRVLDEAIDWFVLVGEQYERLPLSPEGWHKSRVFPGLWLDPQALLADDLAKVLAVVQQGIAGTEHQQFVAELAKRSSLSK
jgi:Uma2 family endonuclease